MAMTARSKRHRKPIAVKSAELALAVPQVIVHRTARMTAAGLAPTRRDRIEFARMHAEKAAAFFESWNALTWHGWRANHAFAASLVRALWTTGVVPSASMVAATSRLHREGVGIVHKALEPVHRRVMANARRLSKRR
jgi:hypothetical protein